LKTDVIAHR